MDEKKKKCLSYLRSQGTGLEVLGLPENLRQQLQSDKIMTVESLYGRTAADTQAGRKLLAECNLTVEQLRAKIPPETLKRFDQLSTEEFALGEGSDDESDRKNIKQAEEANHE